MSSRSSDIVFLLGAGASVEAGIPASFSMIQEIEKLLDEVSEWVIYRSLYYHVKSAIHFAAGLKGQFEGSVTYNIETLVNSLYELERNEDHPLYPFIASWNSRFVSLAGIEFENVRKFRQRILDELKKWMCPENDGDGDYYQGFIQLQRDLTFPLRIFSLNYDLTVERLDQNGFRVETGFGGYGTSHVWDWERFEGSEAGPNPLPQILLYKLHGSIDWKRDDAKNIYRVKQVQNIDPNNMEIIFGRDFKLEAADPYLFYAYEFRRHCLIAKLIVTIGYGFFDAHINKMLAQALRHDAERRLLVVARCASKSEMETKRNEVANKLGVEPDRIDTIKGSAKTFLEGGELSDELNKHLPKDANSPF
jgi:SIR2-like domain